MDGIHTLAFEQYKRADGVSKSMLDQLAHPYTPAHLRAYLDTPEEPPTEAQTFGTILHRALLEPDTMAGAFAVRPDGMDLRTKAGQEWKASVAGTPILSTQQVGTINACVAAVWRHPAAKRLIAGAEFERCLFARDATGTLRKGRLDALPKGGNALPDVKTCLSAAADDFEKSIATYRYHVQAAYYLDLCELLGREFTHFTFIAVEKAPPHLVAVYSLDPLAIEFGRKLYHRDLTLYRHCVAENHWPGYPVEITNIGLPAWAQKQAEELA